MRDNLNVVKGVYIVLIVLGHNIVLTKNIEGLFGFLYSFHVFGFFFLPFIYVAKPFQVGKLVDYFVRYFVPYTWVGSFSAVIYFFYSEFGFFGGALIGFAKGWVLGNAHALKTGTGFQFLWFLPTLFCVVVLRMFIVDQCPLVQRILKLIFLFFHITIGVFADQVINYFPFGLGAALYVFFLCLVIESLVVLVGRSIVNIFVSGALWCFFSIIAFKYNYLVNLGWMSVPSIFQARELVVLDIIAISSFVFIKNLSFYLRCEYLECLGKHSMGIYLFHPFIFYASLYVLDCVFLNFGFYANDSWVVLVQILLTFSISILFSYNLSVFMRRTVFLNSLIFPKDYSSFCESFKSSCL